MMWPRCCSQRLAAVLALIVFHGLAVPGDAQTAFETAVTVEALDSPGLFESVDGAGKPVVLKDGARHLVWTTTTSPEWDGFRFGDSRRPGPRHLRISFSNPMAVGSVLVRGGGRLSVLKSSVAAPSDLAREESWVAARRIKGGAVSNSDAEVGADEYALWVLPPATVTAALRFTHVASPSDPRYDGWLGGACVLSRRWANLAPQAVASASARDEVASRAINEDSDGLWNAWDNGPEGSEHIITTDRPETITLAWPRPVRLRGLNALWAGFAAAEVQSYEGRSDRHPREAAATDWKTIVTFSSLENQYPRALPNNWMDFG